MKSTSLLLLRRPAICTCFLRDAVGSFSLHNVCTPVSVVLIKRRKPTWLS